MIVVRTTVDNVDNAVFEGSQVVYFRAGSKNFQYRGDAVFVKDGPGKMCGVLLFVPCVTLDTFRNA